MSTRGWLAACLLAGVFGFLAGWSARVVTVSDQLTRAIVHRYLAEREYYNRQSDSILAAGTPIKEKKRGTKTD